MSTVLEDLKFNYTQLAELSSGLTIDVVLAVNSALDFVVPPFATQSSEDVSETQQIGTITESGFELDINKMKTDEEYYFDYFDVTYMAKKNKDGDVEISEIRIS